MAEKGHAVNQNRSTACKENHYNSILIRIESFFREQVFFYSDCSITSSALADELPMFAARWKYSAAVLRSFVTP